MDRVRRMLGCDSKEVLPYTGKNVYVGVLDSGVATHPDLRGRIAEFQDFTDTARHRGAYPYYDDNGHGTHVCGILAGSGLASRGRYRGIAPGCILICGKVLDKKGSGNLKNLLKGLKWMLDISDIYPIRILNISIEMDSEENLNKDELRILKRYFRLLWEKGVIIVAAAGNKGPEPMTLSPIGECAGCICVGCHDGSYRSANGRVCSEYSGRGPGRADIMTDTVNMLKKPDIVAPGTDIVSCNHRYNITPYVSKSGTSMSAPIVSGACALCLEKDPRLTNIQLRRIMLNTALDLEEKWSAQGAGMIQIDQILSYRC